MRLHDPQRPTLNGRPLYLNQFTVIQGLRLTPGASGAVELSAFLPISGEPLTMSKRFAAEVDISELESWISRFAADPEGTLESLFADDRLTPALRPDANRRFTANPSPPDETELISDLELLETL